MLQATAILGAASASTGEFFPNRLGALKAQFMLNRLRAKRLIFNEVVTGFRVGLGGAQGYFGVRPDLTVFGKCITGGYPMAGGVGGRAEVIQRLLWRTIRGGLSISKRPA